MGKEFKIHPADMAFNEGADNKMTPQELEEAKKMAGVTTREEWTKRHHERDARITAAGKATEQRDFHNPEEFAFFEDKLKGEVENKKIRLDPEKYIDLFAATGDPAYLDRVLELLGEERDIKYKIEGYALRLIEKGKPEFIEKIINFASSQAEVALDKYSRDNIVKALLSSGVEPKKAARYLPAEISESAKIEEILEKEEYKASYIKGLIKLGELDEARKILAGDKNWRLNDLKMDFYLMAGEKKEDLEILGYDNILNLLRKGKVDKAAACDVIRKEMMSVINISKFSNINVRESYEKENMRPYQLAELIKYSGNPEDIKLAQQTYDELLKQVKEEKIAVDRFQYVSPEGKLLNLSRGLASLELDKETEDKIIGFLKKIDFTEPKDCIGHPERVGNSQYDKRPEIMDELSSAVRSENKKIADFILKTSQYLGEISYKAAVFKLGEDYQKDRLLGSLEDEMNRNKAKAEELEKRGGSRDREEAGRLYKAMGGKQWLAAKLIFEDYKKNWDEESYQRIKKVMSSPIFKHRAGEFLSGLLDDLIKDKNYQQVIKFLSDSEIGEESERLLSRNSQNTSSLEDYFISSGEFNKAKEIIEGGGNKPELVARLITEMYKQGDDKASLENSLRDYEAKNPEKKSDIAFYAYLELMKLTK